MSEKPFISVIVPMYNVEKYIRICINSILGQTFKDFELIIVDNASPDKCYEIVSELCGDNKKVRILRHKKNRGLGPARNTGIENARGEYIYFVDSDDVILPQTLEKLAATAKATDADVIHMSGWYGTDQDDSSPININRLKLNWEAHNQQGFLNKDIAYRWVEQWIKYDTVSMVWLCMCKKEFLYKHDIEFQNVVSEDEIFSFELLCFAEKYYKLHDAFYIHRKRAGSIMTSYNFSRLHEGIDVMIEGSKHMRNVMKRISPVPNDVLQLLMIHSIMNRNFDNHVYPFYTGENISMELDSHVGNELNPTFNENTDFVKYLLHSYSGVKRSREKVLQQNQLLQQQLNRYRTKDALMSESESVLKLTAKIKNIVDKVENIPNRIFLMGTPQHGNLGDQAIIMGEYKILQNVFPNFEIIEIPYDYSTGVYWELLTGLGFKRYVKKSDIILFPGGGNLGNLWIGEEQMRCFIIQNFPDNKIIVFPQSVCFTNDAEGKRQLQISSQIYNAHNDLHLLLRDENSFNMAKNFFPKIHTYLSPDTVTALYGILDDVQYPREDVLFVLRKDKEKLPNDDVMQQLQKYLAEKNVSYKITDTVIVDRVTEETRRDKVVDMLKKFRSSKLVITDRFHGVVFSVITRTPVVAFKSLDTKISSGIKWFQDMPTVLYAPDKNEDEIHSFIDKVCDDETEIVEPKNNFAQIINNIINKIITPPPPVIQK